MDKKKFIFKKWSNSIVSIVLISLIIGVLAGAVSGFYAANLAFDINSSSFLSPLLQHKQLQNGKIGQNTVGLRSIINRESSAISAVKRVNQSVVSIVVSKYVSKYYSFQQNPFFNDDFFNNFFNYKFGKGWSIPTPVPNPKPKKEEKQKQKVGGGTGFIISSKKGLILTNKHVVSDKDAEYTVVTNNGDKYDAKVLARDPFNDIAILKIKKGDLPEVKLGNSDKLNLGQTVIAIGNALGEYRNTVTKGVISGISRRVVAGDAMGSSEVLENVIQTDAAINFGNSGGPLINLNGEVIGINTAINQQGQLIGFAIPINQAKSVIEGVEKYGRIVRPFLGVRYILLNKQIAKENNLSYDYGALIVRGDKKTSLAVIPGSPANKAGLVENDIILEFNGQKITQEHSLVKEVQKYKPGDKVKLKISHRGKEKIVKVVLEEYKEK